MKLLTLIVFSFIGITNVKAEVGLPGYYLVISDKFSESVPVGMCVLKGRATDSVTEDPVQGGVVGETNRVRYTTTNADGKFEVNLNAKDSSFYFYHENYNEIICWKYKFKSQHIVTVNFVALEKPRYEDDIYPVAEKPVIYLYSEEAIEVQILLKPKGNLTFTYPQYDKGWNVNVSPNGLSIADTKYPYLFWEGECEDLQFNNTANQSFGYFIDTDSTIQFLESTLTALGLNSTEMTDFITYWGPRLNVHSYAYVQFLIDEDYEDQIANLTVSPKPDSQLRIYMLFEGTEQAKLTRNFISPELPKFERNGFTLLEWGGSEFKWIENKAIFNPATY